MLTELRIAATVEHADRFMVLEWLRGILSLLGLTHIKVTIAD